MSLAPATPLHRYFTASDLTMDLEQEGPFDRIRCDGRDGLHACSVQARFRLSAHTLNAPRGALTWWILPLEDLAPVSHMIHFDKFEPNYLYYGLLSDQPDLRNRDHAHFHLRYSTDWWRNLTAQFFRQKGPPPSGKYKAIIAPDHFHFEGASWHQIGLSWDREAGQFRLYVNGVLVATETPFLPIASLPAGDTLYGGNPCFAYSDLVFYDSLLASDDFARLYAAEALGGTSKQPTALRRQHTGLDLPSWSWQPDQSWKPELDLTLQDPQEASNFWIQGQQDCVHFEPEGMRIETVFDPTHKDSLEHNEKEMYLWTERVFEGSLALEFEFQVLSRNGLALLMLHASGMQREDFMSDYPRRTDGSMRMVCWENVRNYHWEFYREIDNCRNDTATNLFVKNPWMFPLAYQVLPAPFELGSWHKLQLVQEGARLRGSIDGIQIFDTQDNPHINAGPIFTRGRLALRCKFKTKMRFRHLRVFSQPLPFAVEPL